MVSVIVDQREQRLFVKELMKEGIEVEVKQLIVGDFILQTKNLAGEIKSVGIERKTQHDFLNSIIDKRIFNQLVMLKEEVDLPMLIVEGSLNLYQMRDFHPNTIRGVFATVAMDLQIPILFTQSIRDTANVIALIANRLEKSRTPLMLTAKPKRMTLREQQEFLVASLPGIGLIISKNLLNQFKSIKGIVNASVKDLQNVEKIGKVKAEEIKKVFDGEYA